MIPVHSFGEVLLTIQNLSLSYGDKQILRNCNAIIRNVTRPGMQQGQVVALLGPSGAGKTQLFRCIAGLQKPTEGAVYLGDYMQSAGSDSQVITIPPEVEAGQVGVVFQNYPLLKHRTIWSNLKLAASRHNVEEEKITDLLFRFNLLEHKDKYPAQLSGGQRQRIAIIQQMLCNTHFILMDEPFSGLDVKMKDEVCRVIQEVSLVDELNTTIFTTHDIETACKIADTIWILGHEYRLAQPLAGGIDGQPIQFGKIPGATFLKEINLIERGLAWAPNVELHPNFRTTVNEITNIFMGRI